MEVHAVSGQVFILNLRTGNAGVEIQDSHCLQALLQGGIKGLTKALLCDGGIQIDAQLTGPVVGCTLLERACIGIADDPPLNLEDEIGIA